MRILLLLIVGAFTSSCNNVGFQSSSSAGAAANCSGSSCPGGPTSTGQAYVWVQGGFGLCSKPCNGGNQTQTVTCQQTSDNTVVADALCTGTAPASAQSCNVQACSMNYNWNIGNFGACSVSCGGGTQTRTVLCQDQNGNTVDNSNCGMMPATSQACNPTACSNPISYGWNVTAGACSVACGGGTENDTVICKGSDGSTVDDSQCSGTKPPTSKPCNSSACTTTYTYAWVPGNYGACSASCGGGVQTRSIACQRNDGIFVSPTLCDPKSQPTNQTTCNPQACTPNGHSVTQNATVPPASNQLDVILIVDDSSSMQGDQSKLASRLIQFVNQLDQQNIDYQICLSTTDIGYYKGSPIKWTGTNSVIMTPSTQNKNQVFQSTINSLGAQWSNDEQGIKQVYEMISWFGPQSGNNSGCFRPQAALSVVEVSNEDERSVGGNQSESSVQYQPLTPENLPANLIALVHSTFDTANFVKPFIWNSIIVRPGDDACLNQEDLQPTPAFPGVLLARIANLTNGAVASICDADYAGNLQLIGNTVMQQMPGLALQCTPTNNPVVTLTPSFATQISLTGNQLKFSPALPSGESISATYTCSP